MAAETRFAAGDTTFPAGSFVVDGKYAPRVRTLVDSLGRTAAMMGSLPAVTMHDADVPRVATSSQWSGTQNLGWYRLTFDEFTIPDDLIDTERVVPGNLRKDYDVILMAEQNMSRQAVMQAPAARAAGSQKRQVQVPRHVRRDDGSHGSHDHAAGASGVLWLR